MEKRLPSRIRKKRNLKIKKSTLGVFVAIFAFVFSLFRAFAVENNTISVEKIESASRGDEIDVSINLESVQEYNVIYTEVNFDKDVLEYTGFYGAPVGNPSAPKKNQISMLCIAPESEEEMAEANETGVIQLACALVTENVTVNEDLEIAELYFDVKDDAPGGTSPVTLATTTMVKDIGEGKEDLTVDTEDGYVKVALPVDPTSVHLVQESYELQKGTTGTLTVEFAPEDTSDEPNYSYVSSATNVATVDANGVITAVAPGSATITVTAFGQEMTATVTVVNHITAVTISAPKTEISKEEQVQLSATITPDDTSDDPTITWESSATNVATVDTTGKVTGVGGGTTIITARASNGVTGTKEISVVVPMQTFTTTDTNVVMEKGETHVIPTSITPSDTTDSKEITWTSSNTAVATVSNGTVSALSGGTTTISGSLPNGKSISVPVTVVVPLESVALNETSATLVPEQSITLSATITPSDTTDNTNTVWVSSATNVATVNNGVVTAVAPGNATITVIVGGSVSASANIRVLKAIDGIAISEPTVTLNRNEEKTLSAIISPEDAEEDKTVTWSSSDPTSVSVDQNGKIKGLKGTQEPVTITASLAKGISATATVNVVVLIDEISIDTSSATLNKGDNKTLSVIIDPQDTSEDTTVTWESSATNVATVDANGKVTAVGAGSAVITATIGTHTDTCAITVVVPIESVTIPDADFTLNRGDNKTVSATVNPSDTTEDTTVTWTSSATNVATVDQSGKVIAVGAGSATITATAGGKSDTVKVTVVVPITEFTTTDTAFELVKNTSKTISTTINPSDTTEDTTITWTSSATNIATVDENGRVTGKAAGSATITGRLANDMTITSVVTVTIIPVTAIDITENNQSVLRKAEVTLHATYSPENATEATDITWESSDTTVATVDENGKVTALKEGSATITARMGQLTDSITVTVTEVALEGINLEQNSETTEVGADYQIQVTLEPLEATDDITYTYESSDPEIATVDADGKVTTKKAGTVRITVKASNGTEEFEEVIELTVNTPTSPQTGVTPIWVYGIILTVLVGLAVAICKKKELF